MYHTLLDGLCFSYIPPRRTDARFLQSRQYTVDTRFFGAVHTRTFHLVMHLSAANTLTAKAKVRHRCKHAGH